MKALPPARTRSIMAEEDFRRPYGLNADVDAGLKHDETHTLTGKRGKVWGPNQTAELKVQMLYEMQEVFIRGDEPDFTNILDKSRGIVKVNKDDLEKYYRGLLGQPWSKKMLFKQWFPSDKILTGPSNNFLWNFSKGRFELPEPEIPVKIWERMYERAFRILKADMEQNGPLLGQTDEQLSQRIPPDIPEFHSH